MNIALLDGLVMDSLSKSLSKAERQFYKQDGELVTRITAETEKERHAAERCVVFSYGAHLRKILKENDLFHDFHLDCEYNLDMDGYKSRDGHLCYPDLIIHKRASNTFNLTMIECKGWWSTPSSAEEARNKIRFFMDPCGRYQYSYGLLMTFNRSAITYEWIDRD